MKNDPLASHEKAVRNLKRALSAKEDLSRDFTFVAFQQLKGKSVNRPKLFFKFQKCILSSDEMRGHFFVLVKH